MDYRHGRRDDVHTDAFMTSDRKRHAPPPLAAAKIKHSHDSSTDSTEVTLSFSPGSRGMR
jgi:hypothetical protein